MLFRSRQGMKQRATAGAWVLEPNERGGAIIVANGGREVARNRPFGPVAAGGDEADSRPSRQTAGAYPRFLDAGADRACSRCQSAGGALATKRAPAVNAERRTQR